MKDEKEDGRKGEIILEREGTDDILSFITISMV